MTLVVESFKELLKLLRHHDLLQILHYILTPIYIYCYATIDYYPHPVIKISLSKKPLFKFIISNDDHVYLDIFIDNNDILEDFIYYMIKIKRETNFINELCSKFKVEKDRLIHEYLPIYSVIEKEKLTIELVKGICSDELIIDYLKKEYNMFFGRKLILLKLIDHIKI